MKNSFSKKVFLPGIVFLCLSHLAFSQSTPLFNPDSYYTITCNNGGQGTTILQAPYGGFSVDPVFGPVYNSELEHFSSLNSSLMWSIKPASANSPYYNLKSLLFNGGSVMTYDGNNVFMHGSYGTNNTEQMWSITSLGNGNYTIVFNSPENGGNVLTSVPDSFAGPVLRAMAGSASTQQSWTITEAGSCQVNLCNVSDHSAVVNSELMAAYNSQTFVTCGIARLEAGSDTTFITAPLSTPQSFNMTLYDLSAGTTYTILSYYVWNDSTVFSSPVTFTTPAAVTNPAWDYENTNWACEGYSGCGGVIQSPIALDTDSAFSADLPVITTHYTAFPAFLKDDHTLYVTNTDTSIKNSIVFNGRTYTFLQLHFHTPSEHSLHGDIHPMELHLVHQDPFSGAYLVLAILVGHGTDSVNNANTLLTNIYDNWPVTSGGALTTEMYTNFSQTQKLFEASTLSVNLNHLLPPDTRYFTYSGSLTTPPCSQGVTFLVYMTEVTAGKIVATDFSEKFHGGNARPIQPLNNRMVTYMK